MRNHIMASENLNKNFSLFFNQYRKSGASKFFDFNIESKT